MLSFRDFRFSPETKTAASSAAVGYLLEARNPYLAKIDKIVDDFIAQLKYELMKGELGKASPNMWQRFKQGASNLWYGKASADNPYLYQNRFGELGQKVESVTNFHIPLEHYKDLKTAFDLFVEEMTAAASLPPGTANLKLMKVIDNQGAMLKSKLRDLMNDIGSKMDFGPKPSQMRPPVRFGKAEPPADTAAATTPADTRDEYHFEKLPPTMPWNTLSQEQKDRWDTLGGGSAGRTSAVSGVHLPKIMRLGDPRRDMVKNVSQLKGWGRWETTDNLIKSKKELDDRVSAIRDKRTKPRDSQSVTASGGSGQPRTNRPSGPQPGDDVTQIAASRRAALAGAGNAELTQSLLPFNNPQQRREPDSTAGEDPNAPAIATLGAQETPEYKAYKSVAEKVVANHGNTEEKNELQDLIDGGPDKLEDLKKQIKTVLLTTIEGDPPEQKDIFKKDIDEADTAEKLNKIVKDTYFLEHTRSLIENFRRLCHG